MDLYRRVLRPLLFRLEPEASHRLARPVLRSATLCRLLAGDPIRDPRLEVRIGDFVVANPVGLAPGFDKYGELTAGLSRLGFGYLVPGTVMAEPQGDAPRPRLLRLPEEEALLNCIKLPSKGADYSADQIVRGRSAVPLLISIGANDIDGFVRAHARMEPLAGAIELNVECHNDEDGPFSDLGVFEELVRTLAARKTKPLFLKVNAHHGEAERRQRMAMVERGFALGLDGFSAVGTFLMREDRRLSLGRGVVSGRPLLPWTLQAIRDIREVTGGEAAIRARGGIFSGDDAFEAIAAGADTVEVYTGFVYQGWEIVRRINAGLLARMEREGVPSVAALRGSNAAAMERVALPA
jgi:dihydroorotate dehydrogenase